MKEEELIKYKAELLHYYKYVSFCGYDSKNGIFDSNKKTIDEIKNSLATENAIQKFEQEIEKFLKEMIFWGIDFDEIEVRIDNDLFLSEYFKNKVDHTKNIHERIEAHKELNKNDILPNITRTRISFKAIKKGNIVYRSEEKIELGCIEYNKFISLIEELGYKVSPKTFDELRENLMSNKINSTHSTIKVDFNQPRKPKRL